MDALEDIYMSNNNITIEEVRKYTQEELHQLAVLELDKGLSYE